MNYNTHAPRILLRSPNWVGDAIMATPVVRALKKSMPHCVIHVLAKAWVRPIWENQPDIVKIISLDSCQSSTARKRYWKEWYACAFGSRLKQWFTTVKQLRAAKYDIALVLPNSFSSAWMLFWSGIKKRIGYQHEGRGILLSKALAWTRSHQQMARPQVYLNLTKHAGVDMDHSQEWEFVVHTSVEARATAEVLIPASHTPKTGTGKLTIGIAPGSVAPSRRWPIDRYARLIQLIQKKGYQAVLLGSPGDKVIADKVAKKAGGHVIITAGQTDLAVGLAVIKKMDMVISNDSGAMHMAYAQHVPVLVLQGAADPTVTGPFGPDSTFIRNESLNCAPCVRNECPKKHLKCMKTISVDEVWTKVQEMLRQTNK